MPGSGFTSFQAVASRTFALLSAAPTTPAAGVVTTPIVSLDGIWSMSVQAVFTYGSGGTSAKFYVQTSLDKGTTWIDVMCFAFATTSATKVSTVNVAVAMAAAVTPTDATLADNTILNGLLGDRIRVKYTTVGTYAATTIAIGAVARG